VKTKYLFIGVLLIFIGLASWLAPATNLAQGLRRSAQVEEDDVYVPKWGDTIWSLSEAYRRDPKILDELIDLNPYLRDRVRFEGQEVYIKIIADHDRIYGLKRLGISVPGKVAEDASESRQAGAVNDRGFSDKDRYRSIARWATVLVSLTLLAYIVYVLWKVHGWKLRSPTRGGEPIIPGGISPSEPERVARHFNWMAERSLFGERLSSDASPSRIGPIESGRLTCDGVVDFRDGLQQRRMRRERAYRALYLMPDERQQYCFSLQRCGNQAFVPSNNYSWEPDEENQIVVPAPEPRPAAAAETSSAQKTEVGKPEVVQALLIKYVLNDAALTVPVGATFEMVHDGNSLVVKKNEVVIKTAELKQMPAEKPSEAKTAEGAPQLKTVK